MEDKEISVRTFSLACRKINFHTRTTTKNIHSQGSLCNIGQKFRITPQKNRFSVEHLYFTKKSCHCVYRWKARSVLYNLPFVTILQSSVYSRNYRKCSCKKCLKEHVFWGKSKSIPNIRAQIAYFFCEVGPHWDPRTQACWPIALYLSFKFIGGLFRSPATLPRTTIPLSLASFMCSGSIPAKPQFGCTDVFVSAPHLLHESVFALFIFAACTAD